VLRYSLKLADQPIGKAEAGSAFPPDEIDPRREARRPKASATSSPHILVMA
jgi:hypothetical protein